MKRYNNEKTAKRENGDKNTFKMMPNKNKATIKRKHGTEVKGRISCL